MFLGFIYVVACFSSFSLFLSNIPLCEYPMFSSFTCWWVCVPFWLLLVKSLWPFGQAFCGHIFYFLLGKYLVVGLWGHVVNIDLILWETARPFHQAIVPFCVELGLSCFHVGAVVSPHFCWVFTHVLCCCHLSHWPLSAEYLIVVLICISLVNTSVLDDFICWAQTQKLVILRRIRRMVIRVM